MAISSLAASSKSSKKSTVNQYLGRTQLSSEIRAHGCLGYIWDEKLPSYVGIIINYYKWLESLLNNQDFVESKKM